MDRRYARRTAVTAAIGDMTRKIRLYRQAQSRQGIDFVGTYPAPYLYATKMAYVERLSASYKFDGVNLSPDDKPTHRVIIYEMADFDDQSLIRYTENGVTNYYDILFSRPTSDRREQREIFMRENGDSELKSSLGG